MGKLEGERRDWEAGRGEKADEDREEDAIGESRCPDREPAGEGLGDACFLVGGPLRTDCPWRIPEPGLIGKGRLRPWEAMLAIRSFHIAVGSRGLWLNLCASSIFSTVRQKPLLQLRLHRPRQEPEYGNGNRKGDWKELGRPVCVSRMGSAPRLPPTTCLTEWSGSSVLHMTSLERKPHPWLPRTNDLLIHTIETAALSRRRGREHAYLAR